MTGLTTSAEYKTNVKEKHTLEDTQSSDVWIYVVVPLGVVLSLTFGMTVVIYIYRKRLQKRERLDQTTNISNLTTVSGQNDYETLEHQQCDEHEYSSARQVNKDCVAMNTYVNDVVYREDK
ncbi:uncharacterized protein LOC132724628 [Ruditapes philippinarum]|uniref:uncharacterized protein LOC132724628 n=1 Tax=Ruditapes philippinarum TaxID=129788 RepID=UPI00295AED9E|nr:uncharacterized protein LOC132724628 [Ruditapes philippinarum]